MNKKTLVIQSHRVPLPDEWLKQCCDSVRNWAGLNQFEYEFLGDGLFDYLSQEILNKTASQIVIATDLARLYLIRNRLQQGYQRVVWCDADFYIFAPDRFHLVDATYALGREVWVQYDKHNKLRCHIKVHNAFMMFRQDNVFLDFYIDTATRLISNNTGSMSPQFIGPKLLTALHNVIQCPVQEDAAMFSPLIIEAVACQSLTPSPALALMQRRSAKAPCGANLCHSLYAKGLNSKRLIDDCLINSNKVFQQSCDSTTT